jgi:hypothetical protein
MNAYHHSLGKGAVLPDPWCGESVECRPDELKPYFHFVRTNVAEHTRLKVPLGKGDYLKFLFFMLRHGMSFATVWATLRQLLSERGGKFKWKRASLLDRFQYDVFRHYYKQLRPAFATFFVNSIAHYQHRFWRNMDPAPFQVKPTAEEQEEYADAILSGYREADELVGRFLRLAGHNATLIFCTALSQQPHLTHEAIGGKRHYRPHDFADFLRRVGVAGPFRTEAVMTEEFRVLFPGKDEADAAERQMKSLRALGAPLINMDRTENTLMIGCRIRTRPPVSTVITGDGFNQPVPFFDCFYEIDAVKSARHHPDGMLWIRTPERCHAVHTERTSLRSIAPTVLQLLNIPVPACMRAKSLVEKAAGLACV